MGHHRRHNPIVIAGHEALLCSALDGWRTLQATVAILESAASGQRQQCLDTPGP